MAEAQETVEYLKTTSHTEEVEWLKADLVKKVQKLKKFWKLKCDQMLKHEEEMTARDTEVALLKARLFTLEGDRRNSVNSSAGTSLTDDIQLAE